MRRVIISLLAGLLVPTVLTTPVLAGSLAGKIVMPAKLTYKVPFRAPGYWRGLHNEVLKKLPPLVDPRQKMIVVLEAKDLPKSVTVKPVMHMEDMRFWPPVLPIHRNQTVSFVNDDKVKHEVISDGEETSVSSIPLPPGTKGRHSFTTLGTYALTCKEVPHLKAVVLVLDSPQFARVDATGVFYFPEVPDGQVTLKVWYNGTWIHTQKVDLAGPKSRVNVDLSAAKAKE